MKVANLFAPLLIVLHFILVAAIPAQVWAQDPNQDAVNRSKTSWQHIMSIPHQYTDLNVNGRIVIRGLPAKENNLHLHQLTPDEIRNTVFRHYSTPIGGQVIRSHHSLVAGPVAYVSSPYIYTDFTGVFLTLPTITQGEVGLDASIHSAHVDFRIDPRLTVIKIERGIYLIPGPAEAPGWMQTHMKNARVGDPLYDEKLVREKVGYHALVVPIAILP